MANKELSTEAKILQAANSIFLLYGYHGTTLQQIASKAVVNKAAIHYYFRSKERLYFNVVKNILELIFNNKVEIITNRKEYVKSTWFLTTELYNNKNLFKKTLKVLYPNDWDKELNEIKKWLKKIKKSDFASPNKKAT